MIRQQKLMEWIVLLQIFGFVVNAYHSPVFVVVSNPRHAKLSHFFLPWQPKHAHYVFQSSNRLASTRLGINRKSNSEREEWDNKDVKDDDDDDDDDDEPPEVDPTKFRIPTISFGYNKGRSSPSQRKAMGKSASSVTTIHLCTNCGSEFVQWMGKCPTCQEWNTLQKHAVPREQSSSSQQLFGSSSNLRPLFDGGYSRPSSSSWLDGILPGETSSPIRITDLYPKQEGDTTTTSSSSSSSFASRTRDRIRVPNDDEWNNVLGGGIVPGSLVLVGGDPGVGKSTLLLQIAAAIASLATPMPKIGMGLLPAITESQQQSCFGPVWYCSGEESADQIASRSFRLGIHTPELWLLSETHVDTICTKIVDYLRPPPPPPLIQKRPPKKSSVPEESTDDVFPQNEPLFRPLPPSLLIIDSIQTMVCTAGGASSAGGVTQVRECVALFLRLAKSTGIPVLLAGHVTKSGDVAGPRTVEHMVDAVLYLEGDNHGPLRLLRSGKNRFGSNGEVGVYEMTAGRLLPVSDPSSLFLSHRLSGEDSDGCAIAIALEGMRAITVEVQALVTSSDNQFQGRRIVDGIANSRLVLLMGVLQKRLGCNLARHDVYVNVAGRMRLDKIRGGDNSADLAIVLALVSSQEQIGVRADTAFVGEVGLLGELRPVPNMEKRIQEARRMGFSRIVSPVVDVPKKKQAAGKKQSTFITTHSSGVQWIQCRKLYDAIQAGLVLPLKRRKQKLNSNPLNVIMDDDANDDDDDTGLKSIGLLE